jgi:hypothetical protein
VTGQAIRSTLAGTCAAFAIVASGTLGGAPASAATTVYVSPTGSGDSGCTQAAPCDLVATVAAATSGETIVMEGNDGTYGTSGSPITTEIDIPDGVTLTGDTSQAMPMIYTNATGGTFGSGVVLLGSSTALDYVDVEWSGIGGWAAVRGVGSWDRVIADGTADNAGCTFSSGGTAIVTDSICEGGGQGINERFSTAGPSYTDFIADLYNDTVISAGTGIDVESGTDYTAIGLTLENTIVRSTATPDPVDIYMSNFAGCGGITIHTSYSNYRSTAVSYGTVCNITYTPTNQQTSAPQFVNAAANDFAEAAGSPTIGAGTNDSANDGTLDLAGALREINSQTDIGAYEYVSSAPSIANGTPSGLSTSAATVNATVNTQGAPTSYQVDYGTGTAYGSTSSPAQSLAPAVAGEPIAVSLTGLQAGTTYHYRVVATNSAGSTDGPDETFTTSSPPPPPAPSPSSSAPPAPVVAAVAPVISGFTQTHGRWRVGRAAATFARAHRKHSGAPVGTTFAVTLNEAASLTLTFTETKQGRTAKGGKCVALTRHDRGRPHCALTLTVGSLADSAQAGTDTISFDGVLPSGAKLAPGRYDVLAAASANGLHAAPKALSFTIVKR